MVAAAKAIASKVFFMFVSPSGLYLPYNSILAECGMKGDRLERLTAAQKGTADSGNVSLDQVPGIAWIGDTGRTDTRVIIGLGGNEKTFTSAGRLDGPAE